MGKQRQNPEKSSQPPPSQTEDGWDLADIPDLDLATLAERIPTQLSYSDRREFLEALKQEGLRRNPPQLREWCLCYLEHYFNLKTSLLHEFLFDRLGDLAHQSAQKVSLIAPRGGGKTSIVSKALPIYLACHGLAKYVVLVSDTETQAKLNLWAVKQEIEHNEALTADYPWVVGQGPTWAETRIVTQNGVMIEALGTGAKLRGRAKGEDRPNIIIGDDLENDELVESPAGRENRRIWLQRAVVPALAKGGNIFLVGTALHPDDLIQHTSKSPGWEHHCFKALIKEPTDKDRWKQFSDILSRPAPTAEDQQRNETESRDLYYDNQRDMDRGAVVMWPQLESLLDLQTLRVVIGEAAFQSEKQGNPVSAKRSEFSDELLKGDIWFDHWPKTLVRRTVYCDPSKGRTERSDYSAIVRLGTDQFGKHYCDADLARRDVVQICEDLLQHVLEFGPEAVGVEENGFEALGQLLIRMAGERGIYLPLYSVRAVEGKRVRVRRWLTPPLRNRLLKFRNNSDGASLLIQQIREFPTGQFDDGPDALSGAFQLIGRNDLDVGSEDQFDSFAY